jgi:hypothetical protein
MKNETVKELLGFSLCQKIISQPGKKSLPQKFVSPEKVKRFSCQRKIKISVIYSSADEIFF